MGEIWRAAKKVLSRNGYTWFFLNFSIVFYWLLIMIPVWTTPGNDFLFQLQLMGLSVLISLGILAFLNGLLVSFQVYIWRILKLNNRGVVAGAGGAFGGLIVSVFTCAACYSSIIAFAGLGVSGFFIKYRWLVLGIALILVSWALYKSAQQINDKCEVCRVGGHKK